MTIVKSNRFQALRRYAVGCCHNPYAMIFITHSAVKITRKTYSTFSCWRGKKGEDIGMDPQENTE